jgi:F420 biosynthesis protein FbiB-like protein
MISIVISACAVKLLVTPEKVQMSISIGSQSNTITNPGHIVRDSEESFSKSDPSTLIPTINLHDFLRSRRSVRRFKSEPVPDSVIQNILATATYAPSAHNRQPWRFCVVTDLSVKTRLADALGKDFEHDLTRDGVPPQKIQSQLKRSRDRITSAPVAILLCLDMSEMDSYPDEKRQYAERMMAMQSVASAGLQLLLAVHAEGLGGVWVCSPLFAQETIRKTLNLSETWEPQAMFFIGYPDETPKIKEMKDLKSLVKIF